MVWMDFDTTVMRDIYTHGKSSQQLLEIVDKHEGEIGNKILQSVHNKRFYEIPVLLELAKATGWDLFCNMWPQCHDAIRRVDNGVTRQSIQTIEIKLVSLWRATRRTWWNSNGIYYCKRGAWKLDKQALASDWVCLALQDNRTDDILDYILVTHDELIQWMDANALHSDGRLESRKLIPVSKLIPRLYGNHVLGYSKKDFDKGTILNIS